MICLYDKAATDFSGNGLMVLDAHCVECGIREQLNGEYKLVMELTPDERTATIEAEQIIKAPAPVRSTPRVDMTGSGVTQVYRINLPGERVNLRTAPNLQSRVLHAYRHGTEVVVTAEEGDWCEVAAPDGRSGYMYRPYLAFVRQEGTPPPQSGIFSEGKTREQLFRVTSVTYGLERVEVEALHISYDLRRNYAKTVAGGRPGAQMLAAILSGAEEPHEFRAFSDVAEVVRDDIRGGSPIAAILSDGGLVDQAGGELLRDNFDLYWVGGIGKNRGVSLAYRKNLEGMELVYDTADLVTRIIPIGFDKKNAPLYGEAVDSERIGDYARPYVLAIEYKDVKIGSTYRSQAAVLDELRRRALAEFEGGIDLPRVRAAVEFVDLKNTDVGRDFAAFTRVYLGDTITLRHEEYGIDYPLEVVGYEWDCLLGEFASLELDSGGRRDVAGAIISPRQIGNGSLSARKIGVGAITERELSEDSVTDEQIDVPRVFEAPRVVEAMQDSLSDWAEDKITHRVGGLVGREEYESFAETVLTKDAFDVNINGERQLHISEDGVDASSVTAPNVAARYAGDIDLYVVDSPTVEQITSGAYYRSLSDAVSALNGREVSGNVTVHVQRDLVEDVVVSGTFGGGSIRIDGYGHSLTGSILVHRCGCVVDVERLSISTTAESAVRFVQCAAPMLAHELTLSRAGGTGYYGISMMYSRVQVQNANVQGFVSSVVHADIGSQVYCLDVVGDGTIYSVGAFVACHGRIPIGGGQALWGGYINTAGCTPDAGSGVTPPATGAPESATFIAAHTDTCGGGRWTRYDDADLRQGYLGVGDMYGVAWFGSDLAATLSGKTVRSAHLELTRLKGYGRSSAVTLTLHGTTTTHAQSLTGPGRPTVSTDAYTLGVIACGETRTFALDPALVEQLAAGTLAGIMLYNGETAVASGKDYSRDYCRICGETAVKLVVNYE